MFLLQAVSQGRQTLVDHSPTPSDNWPVPGTNGYRLSDNALSRGRRNEQKDPRGGLVRHHSDLAWS